MKLLDTDHPFFAPRWRRVAIVALTLAWALFEFVAGSPFWGVLFGAIGLYAAHAFFIASAPKTPDDEDTP